MIKLFLNQASTREDTNRALQSLIKSNTPHSELCDADIVLLQWDIPYCTPDVEDETRFAKEDTVWWLTEAKPLYQKRLDAIQGRVPPAATNPPRSSEHCDCGHWSAHPMSTCSGTSCPECYDDMSE